jgi:hypothetical protein
MLREHDREDSQFGEDGNLLSDLLMLGDNFAIPATRGNREGVEFYLLFCQRGRFLVREAFECSWGHTFEVGDYAVCGSYYQTWGRLDKSYVLLDSSQQAYLPSELVVHVKFNMAPQDHHVQGDDTVYYLSTDDQNTIESEYRKI